MDRDDEQTESREHAHAFETFIGYLEANRSYFSGKVMLDALMHMLGPSLLIYDAPQFIFEYARKQGYHIPSYPYDPTSELRAFLAEYDVEDVRGWYARIGVDAGTYDVLGQRRLLVVRDAKYRRKAFVMSIEGRITDDELSRLVERTIAYLAEDEHDDPTVF